MITSLNAIDNKKTIAEHTAIILTYQNTGFLDKENAIKKYKDFNLMHQDYYAAMKIETCLTNTNINIEDAPSNVIINNLSAQLLWLAGEEYLKTMGIKL